ncbi:PGF-pre-PGF domain-containing protein [Halobacterium yunchengense]|uniref:PGF-pre-PGF domain-containing protein n=1 Tax=Halobacterium yunchengense TaxID=3108497 RepID=UPI00300903DB
MTNRRRVAALATALAVAGTLAFPSVAAPLFAEDVDAVGADVELAPSSEYASLEDGELVVDLSASNPDLDGEGVNPDAVTSIDDAFRVRYTGSQYAHVWLTHDSDAVTFRVDGEPIQSEGSNVTLAPNETVAVAVAVDTTGRVDDAGLDDVTVHARAAEPETAEQTDEDADSLEFDGVSLQSRSPTPDSRRFTALGAAEGETLSLDASSLALDSADGATLTLEELRVRNGGGSLSLGVERSDDESPRSLVVAEGAEPLGAAAVSVDAGSVANATVRFGVDAAYFESRDVDREALAVYREDGGDLSKLDVSVTGERAGRVYVEAETPGFSTLVVAADRARTAVESASLNRTSVAPGEAVGVEATVVNDGAAAGERTVAVAVDGEVVAERAVAVPAGDAVTVTVPVSESEPGEYAVGVGDAAAGTFSVNASAADGPAATTQPADGAGQQADGVADAQDDREEQAAGFGLSELLGLVAFLGIVAATLFLVRRRPRPDR